MLLTIIVLLTAGAIISACVTCKEVFSFLYKLFCVFRMLVIMPLFILGGMAFGEYMERLNGTEDPSADIWYGLAAAVLYFVIIFIIDAAAEKIAEKHGIKL